MSRSAIADLIGALAWLRFQFLRQRAGLALGALSDFAGLPLGLDLVRLVLAETAYSRK